MIDLHTCTEGEMLYMQADSWFNCNDRRAVVGVDTDSRIMLMSILPWKSKKFDEKCLCESTRVPFGQLVNRVVKVSAHRVLQRPPV